MALTQHKNDRIANRYIILCSHANIHVESPSLYIYILIVCICTIENTLLVHM